MDIEQFVDGMQGLQKKDLSLFFCPRRFSPKYFKTTFLFRPRIL